MINGPDNSSRVNGGVMCTICRYNNGYDYIPSNNKILKNGLVVGNTTTYYKTTLFTKNEIPKEDKTKEKEKED